jgi:hypothetical protein
MAKHRAVSSQSVRARAVVGGVLAAGALTLGAPAGIAMAHTGATSPNPSLSAAGGGMVRSNPCARRVVNLRQVVRAIRHDRRSGAQAAK